MKKYILVASTGDRLEMLLDMLHSVNLYAKDFKVVLILQEYRESDLDRIKKAINVESKIMVCPKKLGMHNSKMIGLKYIQQESESHIVCNADDDMIFTKGTSFNQAINKIEKEHKIGFVSLGWVKHINMLEKYKYVDVFVKQKIVYTGGGMLFNNKVTDILLKIEKNNYLCDNSLWSAVVYSKGFSNFRYRGSCTIHNICRVGGRKGWISDITKKNNESIVLGREDLIHYKRAKNNGKYNYYIPSEKDLSEKANELHKKNKND